MSTFHGDDEDRRLAHTLFRRIVARPGVAALVTLNVVTLGALGAGVSQAASTRAVYVKSGTGALYYLTETGPRLLGTDLDHRPHRTARPAGRSGRSGRAWPARPQGRQGRPG